MNSKGLTKLVSVDLCFQLAKADLLIMTPVDRYSEYCIKNSSVEF